MNERSIACVRVKDSDASRCRTARKIPRRSAAALGQFWKGPMRCRLSAFVGASAVGLCFYVYLQDSDVGRALRLTIRKCGC